MYMHTKLKQSSSKQVKSHHMYQSIRDSDRFPAWFLESCTQSKVPVFVVCKARNMLPSLNVFLSDNARYSVWIYANILTTAYSFQFSSYLKQAYIIYVLLIIVS